MPNIALVEDEPEAADVLAAFIARYADEKGLELAVTRFGNAMDFEMTHQHFDLVFMDIQMPIMNGYEATAAIRSLPGGRGKVPIIAMTANAFAEDVQLAKNTGMNEHIAKPLELDKLNDVLKQWLQ